MNTCCPLLQGTAALADCVALELGSASAPPCLQENLKKRKRDASVQDEVSGATDLDQELTRQTVTCSLLEALPPQCRAKYESVFNKAWCAGTVLDTSGETCCLRDPSKQTTIPLTEPTGLDYGLDGMTELRIVGGGDNGNNVGYKLLKQMGWNHARGLGKNEDVPVKILMNRGNFGLGGAPLLPTKKGCGMSTCIHPSRLKGPKPDVNGVQYVTCSLCNITLASSEYPMHENGKKHQKKLTGSQAKGPSSGVQYVKCSLCDITIAMSEYTTHENGKRHQNKLKTCHKKYWHCIYCKATMEEVNWESHCAGKKHLKCLKIAGISPAVGAIPKLFTCDGPVPNPEEDLTTSCQEMTSEPVTDRTHTCHLQAHGDTTQAEATNENDPTTTPLPIETTTAPAPTSTTPTTSTPVPNYRPPLPVVKSLPTRDATSTSCHIHYTPNGKSPKKKKQKPQPSLLQNQQFMSHFPDFAPPQNPPVQTYPPNNYSAPSFETPLCFLTPTQFIGQATSTHFQGQPDVSLMNHPCFPCFTQPYVDPYYLNAQQQYNPYCPQLQPQQSYYPQRF